MSISGWVTQPVPGAIIDQLLPTPFVGEYRENLSTKGPSGLREILHGTGDVELVSRDFFFRASLIKNQAYDIAMLDTLYGSA